ncbi:MAG: prepilin-type N-terminal cleavage/methylation domain-containing protein [Verrucomicrobiia bacterium]
MTLVEVLIAIVVLALVMGGIIEGYTQANRMAEYSSMSLAAQSAATQGMEQALAARWDTEAGDTNIGYGHADELGTVTNYLMGVDALDVPVSGTTNPVWNYVTISTAQANPPLRQIRSDAVWAFPLTGTMYTNTTITLRAPDQ